MMEPMLTVKEIACVLHVSYKNALALVKREMRYVRIHRQYRVSQEEFEKYLAKQRRKSIL